MPEELKARRTDGVDKPEAESARVRTPYGFVKLRDTLPSDPHIISPFVDRIMRFISELPELFGDNFEIEVALREALVNAIVHGNNGKAHKHVHVECRFSTDGEVFLAVEDEGRGFQHNSIPDSTSFNNNHRARGRGIHLMRTLMDEVRFERGGSVVHLRKRVKARVAQSR